MASNCQLSMKIMSKYPMFVHHTGVVSVGAGLIGGSVAGGSVTAMTLAGQQCVRCRRGECTPEQHAHQD
jgi:hypothetical protein